MTLLAALLLALPALAGTEVCEGGDVDNDGVQHTCDNCSQNANASQTDTDLDGCGNRCDADFNQDGIVGAADFSRYAAQFGLPVPPADPNLDIHPDPPDGVIGAGDFSVLAGAFGGPPGPSGTTSGTTPCP
jgi:hypothetical protein